MSSTMPTYGSASARVKLKLHSAKFVSIEGTQQFLVPTMDHKSILNKILCVD